MRILFIHEVNYSSKVIYEMHEFPELLALAGHEVTFFHFPESLSPTKNLWRTTRARIHGRAYSEARIELVTPPTFGGRQLRRYLAPLTNLPALRAEISGGRYDVIVLYAVPTTGWQAVGMANRRGVPVVFRALDVSHKIRATPLASLIRKAERYIYRKADVLSANNPAMAKYCVDLSGRTGPTVVNLPPVDLTHFASKAADRSGDATLRDSLGLASTDKVLLYMGSFFEFSGLDVVIDSLVPELSKHPDLKLVLVGGGELEATLRAQVERLNLVGRVLFTGVVSYADLPAYLRMADVAINPFRAELVTHVAFPHKVLQYMAAGVPAVSTSLDGLRGVLGDRAGVQWGRDPAEVATAATALAFDQPEVRERAAQHQLEFVEGTFSKESAIASFEATLSGAGLALRA